MIPKDTDVRAEDIRLLGCSRKGGSSFDLVLVLLGEEDAFARKSMTDWLPCPLQVGIGPGSVCTTRKQTGVGYPQVGTNIRSDDSCHMCRSLILLGVWFGLV